VLALLVSLVWFQRFFGEFAIGAAIYVASGGMATTHFGAMRYGAPLGYAAGAALLFLALWHLRIPPGRRYLVRLIPVGAALGLLFFEVAPLLGNAAAFEYESPWRWLPLVTAFAIVGTLRLALRWLDRPRDYDEVVLLPVGLLTLTSLELLYGAVGEFGGTVNWEGWVSVFLCLVLVACGRAERNGGGLDRLRIPEAIWRIDRLPAVKD
jgi:hypothetical protein